MIENVLRGRCFVDYVMSFEILEHELEGDLVSITSLVKGTQALKSCERESRSCVNYVMGE